MSTPTPITLIYFRAYQTLFTSITIAIANPTHYNSSPITSQTKTTVTQHPSILTYHNINPLQILMLLQYQPITVPNAHIFPITKLLQHQPITIPNTRI